MENASSASNSGIRQQAGKTPLLRSILACLIAIAFVIPVRAAHPQEPDQTQVPPVSPQLTNSSLPSTTPDRSTLQPGAPLSDDETQSTASLTGPLTAAQILAVFESHPEAVIEVKTLIARSLQQDGPDMISDEMLYSQIISSPQVRANITVFLRARGYLSDDTLQSTPPPLAGASALPLNPQDDSTALSGLDTSESGDQLALPSAALRGTSPGFGTVPPSRTPISPSVVQPPRQHASITDNPSVLRVPAPYNLLSLRDLYTQIPAPSEHLKRFGSEVFLDRSGGAASRLGASSTRPVLDAPVGPDYIVGPGDTLVVNMWGSVSQSLTRVIDRDGKVMLPEAGDVQLAGLPLEQAQAAITHALQRQFRNLQVSVSLARLRTIRVYVVGDVQRPGAYDISSLSSPLSALYAAGGPTGAGSLRVLRHYRNQQLIAETDLYDFLLHGVHQDDRLQGGDTLLVPPAGPQVAVRGAVRRPAIYELKEEKNLSQVLDEAGGATVAAAFGHVTVERIDAHRNRETLTVSMDPPGDPKTDGADLTHFIVQDGDRIDVAPILPWSERVVYLEGHVVRPGRTAYQDGMHLSDVLHSYRDLLPEPADRGEIVRLVPPDLHPEAIEFQVPDALMGNDNPPLQPFDTIRIFGRYDADAPRVSINGEVLHPGAYPLAEGETAAQLVRIAGGFSRDAALDQADLMSYRVDGGTRVVGQRTAVRIGDAVLKDDHDADVALHAGDVLTIHQIAGWSDVGSTITIDGEVAHPGVYGFRQGERLSDLLRRAGGVRETAYPEGAVLTRIEVRDLEEKSRAELIREIESSSAAARLSPSVGGKDQSGTLELIQAQEDQVLSRLRSEPPSGRLVIHIGADIGSWAGTSADIEVRQGDVLRIPRRPGFVLVSGQVYNATAITFAPGKSAEWYLRRAGGATAAANRKEIFIIRANGSVIGRRSGGWGEHSVLSTRLNPGDVLVVPQKILGASLFWRNLLSGAQVASSIAVAAAVATL